MGLGVIAVGALAAYLSMREGPLLSVSSATGAAATGSSRDVTISLNPPWATTRLGDKLLPPADEHGRLTLSIPTDSPPSVFVEVSAEGYHTDRRPLSMLAGADETFIDLVRKPYELVVHSTPADAEVWLGDQLKGRTPLTLSLLPEQAGLLALKRPGFVPAEHKLRPPQREERGELSFVLEPAGPILRVDAEPRGSAIALQGTPRGTAPLTLELDRTYLGKEVEIIASAEGYEDAVSRVILPAIGGSPGDELRLVLRQSLPELEIKTLPAGGRIAIDGRDVGNAPLVVTFEPTQVGKRIVVQASLAGSYYGRQELTVPPVGKPAHVEISLEFNAQRVVFLLSMPAEEPTDSLALTDRVVELIHRLAPQQRFAVVVETDQGLEAWPGGLGTVAASSEQKVRAYDRIRAWRPGGTGEVLEMMRSSLGLRPTTVWLFTARDPDRDELARFSDWATEDDISVHIVTTAPPADEDWLRQWVAGYRGTLTVVGRDDLASIVAGDASDSE